MSHLTLFRRASNLGAIMIFVFQKYHHINCNVETKDILTDGTRAAVCLPTWLLIIQTKLFISQFFLSTLTHLAGRVSPDHRAWRPHRGQAQLGDDRTPWASPRPGPRFP